MSEPGYDALADIEQEFQTFTDAMRYKLKVNAHKGKWEDLPLDEAVRKLKAEVVELEEAIKHGNVVEVMLEAADVSNFCLMISDIAIKRFLKDRASIPAPLSETGPR